MRDEGGVAGEGSVVGLPKFHSWDKCTMPLTNINSDWMSNASSGLCINLYYLHGLFISHLGVLLTPADCTCRNVLKCYPLPDSYHIAGKFGFGEITKERVWQNFNLAIYMT